MGREQVVAWAEEMRRDGVYGEGVACKAVTELLRRPLIIWRLANLEQPPSSFVPNNCAAEPGPVRPIYLLLDETAPNAERYTVLKLGGRAPRALEGRSFPFEALADERRAQAEACWKAARAEAASAPACGLPRGEADADFPSGQPPAGKKSGSGKGLWARRGLSLEEIEALLSEQDAGASAAKLKQKYAPGARPPALSTIRDWGGRQRAAIRADVGAHKRALQLAAEGRPRREIAAEGGVGAAFAEAAARGAPAAATAWRREAGETFSVTREPPQPERLPPPAAANPAAARREWARAASWTFCPTCGRRRPHTGARTPRKRWSNPAPSAATQLRRS